MTKTLISVRDAQEALAAADAGADFIDLKEPHAGALGALPLHSIAAVVAALRRSGRKLPVSATIGDLPASALPAILAQVQAVAGCGVDLVKVGITRCDAAAALLLALAGCGHAVVPVFIADKGLAAADVALACRLGFAAVMVDTLDKQAGSLFECCDAQTLRWFVQTVRAAGLPVGLAGALRLRHLPALRVLAPDFAGFRTAVCDGDRSGALSAQRVRSLVQAMHQPLPLPLPVARAPQAAQAAQAALAALAA